MKLKVLEIDINDETQSKRWDEFVDATDEGTIFHRSYWLKAHSEVKLFMATEAKIFVITDYNGDWLAGIPITYRSILGKKIIMMPYLTPYLGTIFRSFKEHKLYKKISLRKDVNSLISGLLKETGQTVIYGFTPGAIDMQPFIWEGFQVNINYTYILSIKNNDEMLAQLEQKRRNDINQSLKSGFQVIWDFNKNGLDFFELNKNTFERQSVKKFDHSLMKNLLNTAHKNRCSNVGVVYSPNGEPLAGCAIVWDTKQVYYIAGGISGRNSSAMSLAIWDAIRYARDEVGLDQFDFEGSMVPGIENYFRKFGGQISPYYHLLSKSSTLGRWLKKLM
jgi:hypothetical protein